MHRSAIGYKLGDEELMERRTKLLKNNTEFEEFIKEFDAEYDTTTYTADLTLRQVWDNFHIKMHPWSRYYADTVHDYINNTIVSRAADLFKDKNVVYSNDPDVKESMIGKLNAVFVMKTDILAGRPFADPISICVFDGDESTVHPGGTRLLFTDTYHETIPTVITDYTGEALDNFPDLGLRPYGEIEFDFSKTQLEYGMFDSSDKSCPSAYDKALNPPLEDGSMPVNKIAKIVKQVTDYTVVAADRQFHNPQVVWPPRRYELTNNGNTIEIDGLEVVCKLDDKWIIRI